MAKTQWICPLCQEAVSSTFERNLALLVAEHEGALCPYKDLPREDLPLTREDAKFLEELKVGW